MIRPRINGKIQAREVRVIDDERHELGVFAIADALKLVASRREDLVEIEPSAVPPLCQAIDYGKYRYRQIQKEKR
jgi:translation initiation factor IF-3